MIITLTQTHKKDSCLKHINVDKIYYYYIEDAKAINIILGKNFLLQVDNSVKNFDALLKMETYNNENI